MKTITSAGVIIYRIHENELQYLLLHHVDGHWDFAKGKVDPGETVKQAALRELHEEAGLQTTIHDGFEESISYQFTDRDGELVKKRVVFFAGQAEEDDVIISHEHQDFIWLPYDQAYQKVTYDSARDVLKLAHEYILERIQRS